jgi:hypothetical protein
MENEHTNPAHALSLDTEAFFQALNQAASIRHIATFHDLASVDISDPVAALDGDEFSQFDYIVAVKEQEVCGLVDRRYATSLSLAADDIIDRVLMPISNGILISAESGILEYVLKAEETPARLVLSGDQIDGIITIADLQKLPVRTAVFSMIMHLELVLTAVLRELIPDPKSIFAMLPKARQTTRAEKFQDLHDNDLCIDEWGALDFCDKRDLLCKFVEGFGKNKKKCATDLKGIERIRNSLAHGGEYALTRKRTSKFIAAARSTREWIKTLEGGVNK